MRATGRMTSNTAKECILGLMVIDMRATIRTERNTAKECLLGLMVVDMRATGLMTRETAKECGHRLMVVDMRATIRMAINTAKECIIKGRRFFCYKTKNKYCTFPNTSNKLPALVNNLETLPRSSEGLFVDKFKS